MSAQLQTQAQAAPRPSLTSAPTGLLQRRCACGGSPGLDGECEECSSKRLTLQRSSMHRADPFKLLRSLAEPSQPDPGATVQPGFGHTFSRVQVHTHVPEQMQPKRNGHEPGDQYEQEADRVAAQVMMSVPPRRAPTVPQLSASPSMIQRALADEVAQAPELAPTEAAPEAATTAETPSAGLIVADEASALGPGQMRKSEFLEEVQRAVCAAADPELAAVGRSTEGCPYIETWIGYYGTRESQQVERTVRRYAPETVGVTTARDYIPLISARVRRAVAVWAKTGEITGVPEGVSPEMAGMGTETGAAGTPSTTGNVQLKGREGGASHADHPQAIQAQLGAGRALDTGLKSRMESAFGYDFSRVRIHTDPKAAGISAGLNARAFTIGSDVAFALGEYQPGTLIGDALIAHELAHVVQQAGGSGSEVQHEGGSENNALEEDADVSAIGAMVSAWRGVKGALKDIGNKAMPHLRSGLQLQRCAAAAAPAVPVVGGAATSGVTELLIALGIVGAATTLESDTPRTGRPPDCNAMMTACLLTSLADEPGSVFGQSRCLFCAEVCRREGGVWPDRAPTTTGFVRCDYWNFPSTE
jgi:Domain of unknown function (DUF4157)